MGSFELWVVRHGETEWSLSGRHTGRTDLPLTPAGEARARRLRTPLAAEAFDRVYSSPLVRARRTAELAGHPEAVPEPLLTEFDYGDYEGLTSAQIHATRPDWDLFRDGCPHGESPAQLTARVQRFVAAARGSGGRVLVFAHGHVLRAVATAFLGWDLRLGSQLGLDTARVGVLSDDGRIRLLERWNAPG